ncbi:MAG: hypothetical protein P8R54_20625 [Myxococcota bacterium]|nr:hypothetical protein [Myxococcota bacterium]
MSKALVLSSIMGSSFGEPMPYHLETDYQPASIQPIALSVRTEAELESLQQSVAFSNTLFGVGLSTGVVGVGGVAVGAVTMVVGIIPLLFDDARFFEAGLIMMVAGAAVTAVAVPITLSGAMLGSAALRKHGEEVSSLPGWIAVSGLGTAVAGAALDVGPMVSGGVAMFFGGSIFQVITTNRAMKTIKREHTSSLILHPVPALDGYGLGVTLRR